MSTHRFREVRHQARKKDTCPRCGRTVTRSRTFWQTMNPFNRNESGEPKSIAEISAELAAEADAWVPDFRHAKCLAAGSGDD